MFCCFKPIRDALPRSSVSAGELGRRLLPWALRETFGPRGRRLSWLLRVLTQKTGSSQVMQAVDSSRAVEPRRSCAGSFSEPWKGTGVLVYSTPIVPLYSTLLHRGRETKFRLRETARNVGLVAADAVQPRLCYLRKLPSTDSLANCVARQQSPQGGAAGI